METIPQKPLFKEFKTHRSNITIYNVHGSITVSFGEARYLETNDWSYEMEINIASSEQNYLQLFNEIVGIVRVCLRRYSSGVNSQLAILQNLYSAGHVKADVFEIFNHDEG